MQNECLKPETSQHIMRENVFDQKNRIGFIDLAKGFGIIIVVIFHVQPVYPTEGFPWLNMIQIFFMPLFFFLSGLFFKTEDNFIRFLCKKINRLLVPFVFFYLTVSVGLFNLLNAVGYHPNHYAETLGWRSFLNLFTFEGFPDEPIWFLLCLFWVNVMFYGVRKLSEMLNFRNGQALMTVFLSLLLGAVGYVSGVCGVDMPVFFDTACSSVPFFCAGYLLYNNTRIVELNKLDKYTYPLLAVLFAIVVLTSGPASYMGNTFYGVSLWQVWGGGLAGSMFVFLLSKKLRRLRFISFWGKYSMTILCTHLIIMPALQKITDKISFFSDEHVGFGKFLVVVTVLFAYYAIVPFFKRYVPYAVGMKDLIKCKKAEAQAVTNPRK